MVPPHQFDFGNFRLDADGRLLFRGGDRILLTPKALDILVALVEKRGAMVTRQDLLAAVWPDTAVEEGTLSSHISLLRKTLGPQFIETIPKRGYRFVGSVTRPQPEPARPDRLLLAVLPFENLHGSAKYDSFSDGLTEELITQLGRINPARLGVIARTSSMTYKSTEKTIEQIGRELNVSHVLEGSARRAMGRIRISAQLIQVSDQAHVWAATYEAELEDVLAVQSRVARAVAGQTQIKLRVEEENRKVVPAAYEAFLRGRYLWNRRTESDLEASVRCFEEAVGSDPSYAPAYAGMADAYLTLMDHGYLPPREGSEKARHVVEMALKLDDMLAEAHVSRGHAAFHEFDWRTAEHSYRRALELNPNYSIGHHYYANHLAAMGRTEAAVTAAEQAQQLDPVSPAAQSNLTSILWLARQHERSLREARKALELAPDMAGGYDDLGRNLEAIGDFAAAEAMFRKAAALTGDSPGSLASLGYLYGRTGRRDEAMDILRRLKTQPGDRYVSPYAPALVCTGLDLRDEAFLWLDRAYEERSSALPFLNVNPRFDCIRDDPRLDRLTRRLGLPALTHAVRE
ncbi:MAG TPA: tetratricopeptide repeat protein [Thermoanaerobaculia bacterium]|nr:tetratricopeptide repeat protein [Thermoanaerobaculia bacterium]